MSAPGHPGGQEAPRPTQGAEQTQLPDPIPPSARQSLKQRFQEGRLGKTIARLTGRGNHEEALLQLAGADKNSQEEISRGQATQVQGEQTTTALPPAVEQTHASGDTNTTTRALADESQTGYPEEIIPPPPDLAPGYRERLSGVSNRLDKILTQAPDVIRFGPTYSVPMSNGTTQQVMTLYYDIPGRTSNDSYRRFEILALDPNGYPIADRYTTVHYIDLQGKKYAMAEGMIAPGIRGAGLTAPVELAHMDVLQREANRLEGEGYDKGIQFHISNANLENLQALEAKFAETQDENLLPQLEAMRAEQQRWQSIYGPQGWLGFNTSWERVFTPDAQGEGLDTASNVALTRVEGKPMVQGVVPLNAGDQTRFREEQLSRLHTAVKRMQSVAIAPQE